MKKLRMLVLTLVLVLFAGATAQAQVYDFEDMSVGDVIDAIGWGEMVAVVADDPVSSGNNVLQFTPNNYNAAPVLAFTLPEGKTLADYPTFSFKAYFAQGDVGWKDIVVEAYQNMPTAQAFNDETVKIGSVSRESGASSGWEEITIDIAGSADMTGTVYIAFGINCSGDSDGNTTIWYADDVDLGIESEPIPTDGYFIDQWGTVGGRYGNWKLVEGESDGDVTLSGDGPPSGNWATVRGGFDQPLQMTEEMAVIVRGSVEFVGDDLDTWCPLRYGFFYHDSIGELAVDSSQEISEGETTHYNKAWTGKEDGAHGYMFTPKSGVNGEVSGQGGNGSAWAINGGSWVSTWSGGTMTLGLTDNAPARAIISEGKYDFEMSVHALPDGNNEVRFYIQKQFSGEQTDYWYGGTFIDTAKVTDKINGFCFGKNHGNGAEATSITGYNLTGVQVALGDPITIPEEPWEAYYLSDWGTLGGRWGDWQVMNGDFVGDVTMSGDGPPSGNWATVRGSLVKPLDITEEKAVVIRGKVEFVGDDLDTWCPLRYGFFYHDSVGTLDKDSTQATPSGDSTYYNWAWTGKEDGALGYMFTPKSGVNGEVSGQGGNGSAWAIGGDNWISTWGGNSITLGLTNNAPARAIISEGTYEFEMSVQALPDGNNEVRFYIQKQFSGEQTDYWYGGTFIDTAKVTDKINGFCFAKNHGNGAEATELTAINLMEVMVDYGDPITVTEKPWQAYYIDDWGTIGDRFGGWMLQKGDFVGDVSMTGESDHGNWDPVRGGFVEALEITQEKAVIVQGKLEVLGDDIDVWGPIRYGFFQHDSIGSLEIDSTQAVPSGDTTHYNMAWSGEENSAYGYMFSPNSGVNDRQSGQGGNGTQWAVNGGSWISTWSDGTMTMGDVQHAPARAVITQGVYNFAMSVHKLEDGTNEVRYYLEKEYTGEQTTYWIGATFVDSEPVTDHINGFCLGFDNNMSDTECNGYSLMEVMVDYGDPITVTEKPWQAYYIDQWGLNGDNTGGWNLIPQDFVGDVTISGESGWSTVRGEFLEAFEPSPEYALQLSGKINLTGGGFEDVGSLRFGVFNSEAAGSLDSTDLGWTWSGTDAAHSGYLCVPPSGADVPMWATGYGGTFGVINNSRWWDIDTLAAMPISADKQTPAGAVAGAGEYEFGISVKTLESGASEVSFKLAKNDGSYSYESRQTSVTADEKYNCLAFSINNSTTTQLDLIEVMIDRGGSIITAVDDPNSAQLPTVYALQQNYPNPFNPTTNIRFDLPKDSKVKLAVFDLRGRMVAELVNTNMKAGYHKLNFDASHLSSGLYIYRLQAGDYVSSKKLMLLK